MEKELILKWLSGYGFGYGSSSGNGKGTGYGYGTGTNYGNGYGAVDGTGDGYGKGSGACFSSGFGCGDGTGTGSGFAEGKGYGAGSGFAEGKGEGKGEKLIKINGEDVYYIDKLPTIITAILGNYAKGFTVGTDYQLTPCYVTKSPNGLFAHGKTLHKAEEALIEKINEGMTDEERIELFCQTFKKGKKYKGKEFFDWHNRLTGSCLYGRNEFIKNHNLSLEKKYTVKEFIALTENDYGSRIIKQLKLVWEKKYDKN